MKNFLIGLSVAVVFYLGLFLAVDYSIYGWGADEKTWGPYIEKRLSTATIDLSIDEYEMYTDRGYIAHTHTAPFYKWYIAYHTSSGGYGYVPIFRWSKLSKRLDDKRDSLVAAIKKPATETVPEYVQ